MKRQLKEIDLQVLLPIILLTLIDLGVGLVIGLGDLADFAITTNYFIHKYIENLYTNAYTKAHEANIDIELINFVTKNSKQSFQTLHEL